MVWDDYYGNQPNPYSAEDFRLILNALELTSDGSPTMLDLIERTREALEREKNA